MSLQLIAKQMEAKGRKGDSMLVHMTADEVAGLQKLAESAGGSLSVNPDTGLVEANFLKRMLPTLIGAGLAATGVGMPLAIAGGALAGGLQAKEDDKSVGMGMLMGGLGAYGGASVAGGLTAAGGQAAQAGAMQTAAAEQATQQAAQQGIQNAAAEQAALNAGQAETANMLTMGTEQGAQAAFNAQQQQLSAQAIEQAGAKGASDYAAQGAADRLGGGIQALADPSSNVGREAFASQVGMKQVGMAAAPMLMPEDEKPTEAPVDDEMYVYDYNVGRTGAESSPLATSSERKYFDGRYSPVRKIRASEYGFAEGGETAAEAPSASEVALAYLMGQRSSSSGGLPALATQMSAAPASNIGIGGDNMYAFDPATGTFLRNPGVPGAESSGSRVGTTFSDGSGGGYQATPSNPDFDTPEKQAAFYAANPTMGELTRTGQTVFSYTPTSLFARAVAPEYMAQRAEEAASISRGDYSSGLATGSDGSPASGYGRDSWSGNLSSYAGSERDAGDASAAGGLVGLAKGGMASGGFVVPADVVSMVGEGNTDAGYKRIKSMIPGAAAIKGKDGGQADTVKTSIDGKQPARVAHGEMYIPPATVKRMGGAKKLYAMMDRVRAQATGSTKQIRPVSLKKAMA